MSEQRQAQSPVHEDELPQDEPPRTADEAQTPAPQMVTSDEPRTIPQIISSQTLADEFRVASQSEPRTVTQPSSDELSQNFRTTKKKKSHKK